MGFARYRLTLSLLAVLIWILVQAGPGLLRIVAEGVPAAANLVEGATSFADAVSSGIAYNILFAIIALLVIAVVLRWTDLGFVPPRPWKSLWLLWFPGLYLLLFYAADIAVGFPPMPVLGVLFVNTLLVGISEELAFRGVLFQGLRSRLGIWPSVLISSVLFGALHVANVLTTGDLLSAVAQAMAATMTGVVLAAVVVRTGSIVPAMALHVLWDFGVLVAVTSTVANADAAAGGEAPAAIPEFSPLLYFLPVAFNLPNFLYALFLLRRRRVDTATPETVEGAPPVEA